MTNFYEHRPTNPTSVVNRSDYAALMLSAIYLYRLRLIEKQACKTAICELIRKYTDHETWRKESSEHRKFVVAWGTQDAFQTRTLGNKVDVDHAIPVERIARELIMMFRTANSANPFLPSNLKTSLLQLEIHLTDRTVLVYVTRAEHLRLGNKLPINYMKTYANRDNYKLARYYEIELPVMRDPDLILKQKPPLG